jgi:hypothetical protein
LSRGALMRKVMLQLWQSDCDCDVHTASAGCSSTLDMSRA